LRRLRPAMQAGFFCFLNFLILLFIYWWLYFQRINSQIAASNAMRSPERIVASNESRSVFFDCMFVYLIIYIIYLNLFK
jgi:hypothetical protein